MSLVIINVILTLGLILKLKHRKKNLLLLKKNFNKKLSVC